MEAQIVARAAVVALLTIVRVPGSSGAFQVYWNVPSELCTTRYNISFAYAASTYGITMNENGLFKGKAVTILYTPPMYPEIKGYKYDESLKVPDLSTLEYINGGLPQNGEMKKHLDAFEVFVNQTVPDPKNNGLIIIDMEHFGATWAQNFNDMEIYRIMSRKSIQDRYPSYTTAKVESEAKLEYERAATLYIVKTIQYGKAIRPYAKWGYYQYPQCFNAVGMDVCSNSTQEDNNQMILLWKNSNALYPSLYLVNEGTLEERSVQTKGRVREAKRAFKYANMTGSVIPYITYKFYFEDAFMPDGDLEALIKVPKDEGSDGVVIWGSYTDFSTLEQCKAFDDYMKKSIGPLSKKYISK